MLIANNDTRTCEQSPRLALITIKKHVFVVSCRLNSSTTYESDHKLSTWECESLSWALRDSSTRECFQMIAFMLITVDNNVSSFSYEYYFARICHCFCIPNEHKHVMCSANQLSRISRGEINFIAMQLLCNLLSVAVWWSAQLIQGCCSLIVFRSC